MSFANPGATTNTRRMRGGMATSLRLWRYILKAHIGPFLLAFVVTMFVFLLQFLMRFIEKIVGKGLDFWTILQLIALNLAWMVVLALPMAGLVASLMAFGSLSSSQEVTSMKASGVSFLRMLFPVLVAASLLAYADLWFNNEVLPDANHRAKDLMTDIQRKKPTFVVRQGEFTDPDALPGYAILAKKTYEHTNNLEGIVIFDHTSPSETKVITANSATFSFTRDFSNLVMNLHDGEFHQAPLIPGGDYRNGKFRTYEVRIPTSGYDFMRQESSERGDRELSANDLLKYVHTRDTIAKQQTKALLNTLDNYLKAINSPAPDPLPTPAQTQAGLRLAQPPLVAGGALPMPQAKPLAQTKPKPEPKPAPAPSTTPVKPLPREVGASVRQHLFEITSLASQTYGTILDAGSYMVEVHKKYALPVACLVFVLVGAPLGALARRGGIGVGVGFSIGFFILYWACLIGGEKLADRGITSPWLGMWIANIVLGVLGIYLIIRVMNELTGIGISFAPLVRLFRRKS